MGLQSAWRLNNWAVVLEDVQAALIGHDPEYNCQSEAWCDIYVSISDDIFKNWLSQNDSLVLKYIS